MIEEYSDKDRIPMIHGGQGRTDEKTEGDGWVALWVVLGIIALVAAGMLFGGC